MKIITHKDIASKQPLFIGMYGCPGIGKSSQALTLTGKTLYLDAENGAGAIIAKKNPNIDFISLSIDDNDKNLNEEDRFQRLTQFMEYVKTDEVKKKYDNIFVDSLSEISQNIFKHMQSKYDGYKLWGEYTSAMVDFIKFFRDLKKYNVIFTALEERIDVEGEPSYFFPAVGGKKVKEYLMPCFDEVYRMVVDAEKKRFFVCQPTVKSQAKNRFGGLGEIEDADLGVIMKKLGEVK